MQCTESLIDVQDKILSHMGPLTGCTTNDSVVFGDKEGIFRRMSTMVRQNASECALYIL